MSDDSADVDRIKKMTFTLMCKKCKMTNGYTISSGYKTISCRGCGRVLKI